MQAGAIVKAVKRMLGRTSAAMTLDIPDRSVTTSTRFTGRLDARPLLPRGLCADSGPEPDGLPLEFSGNMRPDLRQQQRLVGLSAFG